MLAAAVKVATMYDVYIGVTAYPYQVLGSSDLQTR
jgi:hypothetical protein